MAKQGARTVTPRLRFPEFRGANDWKTIELRQLAEFVTERVGATDCVPYTITSGVGLVSQQEKLGRTIAGNSLKNYVVLQRNDFAYNKSATKTFPQGFIARYVGDDRAAVPNSIFTCLRADDEVIDPVYLEGLFSTNLHGNWLRPRIAVGARAHGSLNVSDEDLMALPVPLPDGPSSLTEQQKIADCLTSLDEVIAAQGRRVEALKAHKRGLMQQLFPREGETHPRLRFPEFRDAPDWTIVALGELLDGKPEYGVNAPAVPFSPSLPSYLRITDIDTDGRFVSAGKVSVGIDVTEENYLSNGDIVLARTGASVGKSYCYREEDGRLVFAGFLIRIRPDRKKVIPTFVSSFLTTQQYWNWVHVTSARSGQPGINGSEYAALPIPIPPPGGKGEELAEQQCIADFLGSLDDRITAESHQLAALKAHKQGLMQNLFPAQEGGS